MFGFPMRLKTDQGAYIVMRPFEEDEMQAVANNISSYNVARTLSLQGSQTVQQERDWFERISASQDSVHWAICWANSPSDRMGVPIGTSVLDNLKNYRATSGVVIFDQSAWGQGIATAAHRARCYYADQVVGLNAIDSGALRSNRGSINALCRVGYEHVGSQYGLHHLDGRVEHHELLLWVNPNERNWNYFWGDSHIPIKFHKARKRARKALDWASEAVAFL